MCFPQLIEFESVGFLSEGKRRRSGRILSVGSGNVATSSPVFSVTFYPTAEKSVREILVSDTE
jgi:hypothetical protein